MRHSLGLTALLLAGCSTTTTYEQSDRLIQDRRDDVTVVAHLPYDQGMQQLRELGETNKLEELYAFIPPNTWYELGNKEKIEPNGDGGYRISTETNIDLEKNLLKEHKNIALIHYHPQQNDEFVEKLVELNQDIPNIATIASMSTWMYDQMPSLRDLSHAYDAARYHAQHHDDGYLKFSIVGKYGVVSFQVTQDGVNKNYTREEKWQYLDNKKIVPTVPEETSVVKMLHISCGLAADDNFIFWFSPYDDVVEEDPHYVIEEK